VITNKRTAATLVGIFDIDHSS